MEGGLPDLEGRNTKSVEKGLGKEEKDSKEGAKELLAIEALLELGSLEQEEKFDGDQANETVFLCYSSVCPLPLLTAPFATKQPGLVNLQGTTGLPKVRLSLHDT